MSLHCRRHDEFYKCLYSSLKEECYTTASAIFTKYHLLQAAWQMPHCDISK